MSLFNVVGGFLAQKGFADRASRARSRYLDKAGDTIEGAREGFEPYRQYGRESLERMNRLFADPSYLESLPGYQFTLQQGLKGTTAQRSRSSIFSGETLKALTEYAGGLAQQTYGDEWKRIQAGIETGMGAEKGYMDASTTLAEIQAAQGEAKARRFDQYAAAFAGEQSFGRQIFGQWSGAFASATASSVGGMGGMGGG